MTQRELIAPGCTLFLIGCRGPGNVYGGYEVLATRIESSELADLAPKCLYTIRLDSQENVVKLGPIWRGSISSLRIFDVAMKSIWLRNFDSFFTIIFNPVNIFAALLIRHQSRVLLHMDGMEDHRKKWGFVAKRVHRVARYVAVKSTLQLVTDSRAIQEWYRKKYGRETIYIPYGGCEIAEADAGHRWNPVGVGDFYMVLARPEPENQIFEICRAFLNSSSPFRLVVVGAPRVPTKYWKKVQRLVGDSPRVHLAGSIYDRDRRCEMYVNTRGVIHGHTVGGTNPSLVDALSHGCPVLPHGNPYNREVAGETGVYWNSEEELVAILNDADRVYPRVNANEFIKRYNWNDVANAYFTALGLIPKEETKQ